MPLGQSVPRLMGWSGSPSTWTTEPVTFFALSPSVWMITPHETEQYGQVLRVSVVREILSSRISARASESSNSPSPTTPAAVPLRNVRRSTCMEPLRRNLTPRLARTLPAVQSSVKTGDRLTPCVIGQRHATRDARRNERRKRCLSQSRAPCSPARTRTTVRPPGRVPRLRASPQPASPPASSGRRAPAASPGSPRQADGASHARRSASETPSLRTTRPRMSSTIVLTWS